MDYRQQLTADFMYSVKQWNGVDLLPHPKPLCDKDLATYKLRLKLTLEETFEALEAVTTANYYAKTFKPLLDLINQGIENITIDNIEVKPVDLLDALTDIDVVNTGFANLMGFDLEAANKEVYKSNMSKLDENGNPIFREDGKLLKSSLYVPPNLQQVYETTSFVFNK